MGNDDPRKRPSRAEARTKYDHTQSAQFANGHDATDVEAQAAPPIAPAAPLPPHLLSSSNCTLSHGSCAIRDDAPCL